MNSALSLIRVACAPFAVRVADPARNARAMAALLAEAGDEEADIVLFPELALTGYTCGDLFLRADFMRRTEEALGALAKETERLCPSAVVAVGLPVLQRGTLFDACALIQGGSVLGVVPKSFVPNSQEFYERRWFAPAEARVSDELTLLGKTVPFTPSLLVEIPNGPVLACEICQDLWVPSPPSAVHARMGATLVLNPSASNEVATKARYRSDLVRMHSARCLTAYAYCSSGAGESTTDLVFSGHVLVAANGRVLAETLDGKGLVCANVDYERLANDRLKDACAFQQPVSPEERAAYVVVRAKEAQETDIAPERVDPRPFVPTGNELEERCREILGLQSRGLAARFVKTGARCLVVGVSGGLDSTLALLVCADALDGLGLERSRILAVTMPGFGTTDHTLENARKLMSLLGATSRTVDIRAACLRHFEDIGHPADVYDVTYENAQARERTQILMDLANQEGGLVVGTGDMSELALGWATYNGDHMSMYGVNASVPKTLVRFLVEEYGRMHDDVRDVLASVCATEISPELLPPDRDGNRQSTEGTIGRYELHDFFLYHFVRDGFGRDKILALARIAFPEVEESVLASTLETFVTRFFTQQYKRSCLPDGPKVGTVSLSPRGDWRMPSDLDAETGAGW